MSYNVYIVADLGAPRDHHAIFIETDTDLSGTLLQVKGNIQTGMEFESKHVERPENSETFVAKTLIGTVASNKINCAEQICQSIPPPKKQFQGAKRLYPNEPLRRCQEWTTEAVEALKSRSILE